MARLRPGRGAVRHLRALAASLACVTAAFGAHAVSGGQVVPTTVVGAFVLCGAVAWAIAGARLGRAQLLGLLVLCQVGVHVASMATQGAHPATMGAAMLLTHGAATIVSLVALSRGEAFVWAVAQHLALRPLAMLLQRTQVRPADQPIASTPVAGPHAAVTSRVTPVRGPPAGTAPALARP